MSRLTALLLLLPVAALALTDRAAVHPHTFAPELGAPPRHSSATGPLVPLTAPEGLDPARIALGRKLFEDPGLSGDGSVSCRSCHDTARGGADSVARSAGTGGMRGDINAPTVFNASLNIAQFWDGRAATLEEQVDGPLLDPVEMGSSWERVLARIEGDGTYRIAFGAAYEDGVTPANVRDAIATYERTLVTAGGRFDRWLAGDTDALSPEEVEGYALFRSYGCSSCPQGARGGGNMFQAVGIMGDYFADRGTETRADLGRYNVTGQPEDIHVFRVPSLRLAVLTAPYLHDGSVATLDEAIEVMGRYQLGREIPAEDRSRIIAFLGTLPGPAHPDAGP